MCILNKGYQSHSLISRPNHKAYFTRQYKVVGNDRTKGGHLVTSVIQNISFSHSIIRQLLLRLTVLIGNFVQIMAETYTAVRDQALPNYTMRVKES